MNEEDTTMKKPSLIEISKWEKEWYSIRMPTITKQEFINKKKQNWYRQQYYNNK
jgi:hypothetical protein